MRFTVLFLFAALRLSAQISDYTIGYYPTINLAETAITSGDYARALEAYQSAFYSVESPQPRDYHNAALCAMYLNQPDLAFGFFEKMALLGVTLEYFKRPEFAQLQQAQDWKKFEAGYEKLHRRHLDATDLTYRRDLTVLLERDQHSRSLDNTDGVYTQTIRTNDSLNIQEFLALACTKGFPSPGRIGTDFPGEPIFELVLQKTGWPELAPVLVKATKAGEIDPVLAGRLLELQGDPTYQLGAAGLLQIVVKETGKAEYYLSLPGNQRSGDNARMGLGLEPVANYVAKCLWRQQHPDTPFRINDGYPLNVVELEEARVEPLRKMLTKVGG